MLNQELIYKVNEIYSEKELTYTFISKGKNDIIKVIQYSVVQKIGENYLYNLGFGDYNVENDTIIDDIASNNNDTYRVFNTVLSTIPKFFEKHKNDYLIISGSDAEADYISQCIKNCIRKCTIECKKYNRRINIYNAYINKNFETLIVEYQFFGGNKDQREMLLFENYLRFKKYDFVLILKKQ